MLALTTVVGAQEIIPLDTNNWTFNGKYILETYKGKQAVYSQAGSMRLKNRKFLNGTIKFDM